LLNAYLETLPDLRASFRVNYLPIIPASRFHTHGDSAAERTSAAIEIALLIRKAGFEPYFISMAASDQDRNERGCRYYYWPKDLKADFRDDEILENDVLVFIDVDYHCDMTEYLKYQRPIIMYTLVPDHTAYHSKEYSYRIKNDNVEYLVSGGAQYRHKIWDYDVETLAVDDDDGNTTFFNVEQRLVDGVVGGGRKIITLMPYARAPTLLASYLQPTYLKRKRYTKNGVNMIYNPINDTVCVSLSGSDNEVTMTGRVYDALRIRLKAKSKAFTPGDIESYLYDDKNPGRNVHVDACLLYEIFSQNIDEAPHFNVINTSLCETSYTPLGARKLEETKSSCTLLTNPIVSDPFRFPTKCANSEDAAIAGRIIKPANNKRPPKEFGVFAREFVDKIIGDQKHTGQPLEQDEIIAMQNKPLQRARTEQALHKLGIGARNKLKTFEKAEGSKIADPRIITTCSPEFTLELSRFTYAFKKKVLVKQKWYGPGKTPKDSIRRIKQLAVDGTIETDFSRFDGSISKWLQHRIVYDVYTLWADPKYKDCMRNYLDQVFVKSGKTSSGRKYKAGWGTRSGSPITTDGNTMINAFVSFAALRNCGYNVDEAWDRLGLYAGDDGLNRVLPNFAEEIEFVAAELGLDIKLEITATDQETTYLGRIFPKPLTHSDSYQDPIRTLCKIHLSANKNVSTAQAATNKATGYLITDPLTPIISQYCNKVLEITKLQPKHLLGEELYKLDCGAWPQSDACLIRESFNKRMGINNAELEERITAINAVQSLDDFPVLFENKNEIKISAQIGDDDIVHPRNRESETQTEQCQQTKSNSKLRTTAGKDRRENTSKPVYPSTSKNPRSGRQRESNSPRFPSNRSKGLQTRSRV